MRYDCDDPAFKGDFVEFSDSWSRAQARAAWDAWGAIPNQGSDEDVSAAEERLLACLRPKIVALRLTCIDAAAITKPDDLTPQRTEEIDTRLYAWWINLWMIHLKGLSNLGNALGRRLWDTSAASQTKATTEKKPQASARKSRRRS